MATITGPSAQTAQHGNLLTRFFPILSWLPHYDRSWLRGDVIAGITVVALLVPEGMAYAELAGMPPETKSAGQASVPQGSWLARAAAPNT